MQLARFLNKIFKKGGFILIDANSKEYIIGNPSNNPIKLRILNKKLHYKLLFHPDLYFGEAYTDGEIKIENGSLTEFLDLALMNIGRGELNFFVGGFVMATILNLIGGNGYFELPAIHQLMLGGFMFGMVFMATDPVTAAHTNAGKLIYGFLGGFLGILIRMVNPAYPEGIMLAILIANVFAPLIDHMVIQNNIKRRLKRLKTA